MDGRANLVKAVEACPLLAGLDVSNRSAFLDGLALQNVPAGRVLLVQGESSSSAFLLVTGSVEVLTHLPGGGEAHIASVGSGSVLGEVGLLLDAPRSASVRTEEDCQVLEIPRRVVDAWLAQQTFTGLRLFRNLTHMLALRTAEQRKTIAALLANSPDIYAMPLPTATGEAEQKPFDVVSFLPHLPSLHGFTREQLTEFYTLGHVHTLRAGATICGPQGSYDLHLVVRGAAVTGLVHGARCHPLAILGPGSFIGIDAILTMGHVKEEATTLNDTTVLSLSGPIIRTLIDERSGLAAELLRAMASDRAQMVAKLARHTTRLAGLARIKEQQSPAEQPVLQSAE